MDDRAEALLDELEQEDLFEGRSGRGSDPDTDDLPTTSQPVPAAARPPVRPRTPLAGPPDDSELSESTQSVIQEQENLLDKLQAAGFFGEGDDDEEDFDMLLEEGIGGMSQPQGQPQRQQRPTSARGRKKLKSVGRRRHLGKGSRAPR